MGRRGDGVDIGDSISARLFIINHEPLNSVNYIHKVITIVDCGRGIISSHLISVCIYFYVYVIDSLFLLDNNNIIQTSWQKNGICITNKNIKNAK